MTDTTAIEDEIVDMVATEWAARVNAVVESEVARLVANGWRRDDAVLEVAFSEKWPYANEMAPRPKGVMGSAKIVAGGASGDIRND